MGTSDPSVGFLQKMETGEERALKNSTETWPSGVTSSEVPLALTLVDQVSGKRREGKVERGGGERERRWTSAKY
jgi:hypothetical protein